MLGRAAWRRDPGATWVLLVAGSLGFARNDETLEGLGFWGSAGGFSGGFGAGLLFGGTYEVGANGAGVGVGAAGLGVVGWGCAVALT